MTNQIVLCFEYNPVFFQDCFILLFMNIIFGSSKRSYKNLFCIVYDKVELNIDKNDEISDMRRSMITINKNFLQFNSLKLYIYEKLISGTEYWWDETFLFAF